MHHCLLLPTFKSFLSSPLNLLLLQCVMFPGRALWAIKSLVPECQALFQNLPSTLYLHLPQFHSILKSNGSHLLHLFQIRSFLSFLSLAWDTILVCLAYDIGVLTRPVPLVPSLTLATIVISDVNHANHGILLLGLDLTLSVSPIFLDII